MDARIFDAERMGLATYVRGKPRRYRSPRLQQWHEARETGGR